MTMYRAVDVWERKSGRTVVRYRCFESLQTGRFCVQSADFYHDGELSADSDNQLVELFTEQEPAHRSGEHDTLAAAISAHKKEFADLGGQPWDGAGSVVGANALISSTIR